MSLTSSSAASNPWSDIDEAVLDRSPRGALRAKEFFGMWLNTARSKTDHALDALIVKRRSMLANALRDHPRGEEHGILLERQCARLRVSLVALEQEQKGRRSASEEVAPSQDSKRNKPGTRPASAGEGDA